MKKVWPLYQSQRSSCGLFISPREGGVALVSISLSVFVSVFFSSSDGGVALIYVNFTEGGVASLLVAVKEV